MDKSSEKFCRFCGNTIPVGERHVVEDGYNTYWTGKQCWDYYCKECWGELEFDWEPERIE